MEKGYEAATMRDIAAAMHVVPGLCYRYFESKQVLYDTVIEQYVKDITYPMVERLKEKDSSLDGFLDKMAQLFIQSDGKGWEYTAYSIIHALWRGSCPGE